MTPLKPNLKSNHPTPTAAPSQVFRPQPGTTSLVRAALIYAVLGLFSGIYARELMKAFHFQGHSSISALHVHYLVLGALVCLILMFFRQIGISEAKRQRPWLVLYHIGLNGLALTMGIRGTLEVRQTQLSRALDASLSGVAGLTHIALAISLMGFFIQCYNRFRRAEAAAQAASESPSDPA